MTECHPNTLASLPDTAFLAAVTAALQNPNGLTEDNVDAGEYLGLEVLSRALVSGDLSLVTEVLISLLPPGGVAIGFAHVVSSHLSA